MVWDRGVVRNPDNTIYSDVTVLGADWCKAHEKPTWQNIIDRLTDADFRRRDTRAAGGFRVSFLPPSSYDDAAARPFSRLLEHVLRAHNARVVYANGYRATSRSRSASRSRGSSRSHSRTGH